MAASSARDEILARVRASLTDVADSSPDESPIHWQYGLATDVEHPIELFLERVADYKASVDRIDASATAETVVKHLRVSDVKSVVLPAGLDAEWRKAIEDAGITVHDDTQLTATELNEIDAVVTAAAVGIAETGTVILDHREDQGRRALSLIPDVHVCVVRADQVVTDLPEAISRLQDSVKEGLPVTMISGPSATSDIELSRVEGVHGPRTLRVIVQG